MSRARGGPPIPVVLVLVLVLALATVAVSACGGRRILGFGGSRDGTLLVRHTKPVALEIVLDGDEIGLAGPNEVTCFRELRTGSLRLEARRPGTGELARATSIVLPPEQPQLWDIDHDQVLDGRAHARVCEERER